MSNLICQPCPEPKPFVPETIAPVCDPCPVPAEDPKFDMLPKQIVQRVVNDCIIGSIYAMQTQFFCKKPPRGCK